MGKKGKDVIDNLDINARSSKCVVAITEAPSENIITWSSRTYSIDEGNGPIKSQINTGVHSLLVWRSIIFQLLVSFHIMDMKKITIRNMTWNKNVYIKTLDNTSNVGFWKYKIGGVDFFIPNMGFLLMIDSSFDDVDIGYRNPLESQEIRYKIVGDMFNDGIGNIVYGATAVKSTHNNVNDELKNNFKSLFSTNIFTGEFTQYGGTRPPGEIISLMEKISDQNYEDIHGSGVGTKMNFKTAFIDLFPYFLHNKIGELVTENEKPQLYDPGVDIDKIKRGNLVGVRFNHLHNSYNWGIFVGQKMMSPGNIPSGISYVIFNDIDARDPDTAPLKQQEVDNVEIARVYGKIDQKYKPDRKINSDDELLETYVISY